MARISPSYPTLRGTNDVIHSSHPLFCCSPSGIIVQRHTRIRSTKKKIIEFYGRCLSATGGSASTSGARGRWGRGRGLVSAPNSFNRILNVSSVVSVQFTETVLWLNRSILLEQSDGHLWLGIVPVLYLCTCIRREKLHNNSQVSAKQSPDYLFNPTAITLRRTISVGLNLSRKPSITCKTSLFVRLFQHLPRSLRGNSNQPTSPTHIHSPGAAKENIAIGCQVSH